MRKITKLAVDAFYSGQTFSRDNTTVDASGIVCELLLFGNCIAKLHPNNTIEISSCGYYTKTTKERLNGLLESYGLKIFQKNFKWYIWNSTTGEQFLFVDGMEIRV